MSGVCGWADASTLTTWLLPSVINPLYAFIELHQSKPAITALVNAGRIKFDLAKIAVPIENNWIIISPVGSITPDAKHTWSGNMRVTALARGGHTAQEIIETVIDELWNPLVHWSIHRLDDNWSQEGAVITIHDLFNLSRQQEQLSGDIWHPSWAADFGVQVSEVAHEWAS